MWPILNRIFGIGLMKKQLLRRLKSQLDEFLASNQIVAFQKCDVPLVSVIIPVFNGAHHTLKCLLALSKDKSIPFEVIVFDDASSDATSILLQRFENIVSLRADVNAGSINGINRSSKVARGKYLLLLNNDATIINCDLAAALKTFNEEPNVGAIGARIVQADGRLQEAGSMIFQDGITNGYLRFSKPDDPRAMFMRDVDYCSAMYLLIETQLFKKLGGLDVIYAPAYFEETDLCMKLRANGLRVIYDPTILVEHFEFGSHQSGSGRRLIEERRPIFLNRWQQQLKTEGYSLSEHANPTIVSALRLLPKKRLLFILQGYPEKSISEEVQALVKLALEKNFHIAVMLPKSTPFDWGLFFASLGKHVEVVFGSGAKDAATLISKRPNYFTHIFSPDSTNFEIDGMNQFNTLKDLAQHLHF